MQQFKSKFKDLDYKGTISNIQSCLRMNDIDQIGDGTHLLYFNMIGLFSFRELSLPEVIEFWIEFLKRIKITPDWVTIHPDKTNWVEYYKKYNIEVRFDDQCIWTDGEIGGYCTEFYKNNIEIGNIVNTMGDCIDVGFGLERIEMILFDKFNSKEDVLKETISKIIECGFKPTYNNQGSLLRKLLRICYLQGIEINHQYYIDEIKRQEKILEKWNRLKDKHNDKSKEWWWSTHGIDIDFI